MRCTLPGRISGLGRGSQAPVTLKGHTGFVHSISFSPNGKALASASDDTTIRLWDVTSGDQKAILKGHRNHVLVVAFSPDGKSLASAGDDRTVRLWNVERGKNTATLSGHTTTVRALAFSPDGKTVASADGIRGNVAPTMIRLWDATAGKEKATFKAGGSLASFASLAFSPDGKLLASAGFSGVKLWDLSGPRNTFTFKEDTSGVWAAAGVAQVARHAGKIRSRTCTQQAHQGGADLAGRAIKTPGRKRFAFVRGEARRGEASHRRG